MAHHESIGPRWLLILPRPPSDLSLHTLSVAYGPGLSLALKDASQKTNQAAKQTILDVSVACATLDSGFAELQCLFNLMYTLVCITCAENAIDLQYENDVDVRVCVFDCRNMQDANHLARKQVGRSSIISLTQFAQTRRTWERICSLESENGEDLLRKFLQTRKAVYETPSYLEITRLPGGLTLNAPERSEHLSKAAGNARSSHLSVAVGGTFDHLHAGHKLLLTMTALLLQVTPASGSEADLCLTIGITGDELLKNKRYVEQLEDWDRRQKSVQCFLEDFLQLVEPCHMHDHFEAPPDNGIGSKARSVLQYFNSGLKVRYVEIFDPFGPTITDPAITALAISAEKGWGDAVNARRKDKGWPPLEVFQVEVLSTEKDTSQDNGTDKSEDFRNKLSSTEVRSRIAQKSAIAPASG